MYPVGKNRLFYESKSDIEKTVEVEFLNPDLQLSDKLPMIHANSFTYYIDIWFRQYGPYLVKVYEGGIEKHKEILNVTRPGIILYPKEKYFI